MQTAFRKVIKIPGMKLALEFIVLLILYFTIKSYMQKDLLNGPVPALETTLLSGDPVSLKSLQGKPVLLYFWATWCSVCKLAEHGVSELSKDHVVVTIAMNSGSGKKVLTYLSENNLEFPVIADPQGSIANQFGVRGVPTSFIINSKGHIAYTEVGYTTAWGLRLRLWLAQE